VLVQHGYEVCGIARTVAEAVALGRLHKPDLALIDLRLADGGLGTEVAAQLGALGRLGVLYATGNISRVMSSAVYGDACLSKPYRSDDLVRGLEIVAEIVATGKASPPFGDVTISVSDQERGTPCGSSKTHNGAPQCHSKLQRLRVYQWHSRW
jgi:ActR/RegA family two-component response regulator